MMSGGRTFYDKIIDQHRVRSLGSTRGPGEKLLLYVDRTVLNEYTSPQAFSALRDAGRGLWRPGAALGVVDHVNPTDPDRAVEATSADARRQIAYFSENGRDFGFEVLDVLSPLQGIEHVVLPELGLVQPGLVIAAGDSHTSTYGAFGAVGFGIGTSDIEHLLATQTVRYTRLGSMRVTITGKLSIGATAKDVVMSIVRRIGAGGAVGMAMEIAGDAVRAMSVEQRMTICNMAMECGARVAVIEPDEAVFAYVAGRVRAPSDEMMELAIKEWSTLRSDPDTHFAVELAIRAEEIEPMVTWGTSPDQAAPIGSLVPNPIDFPVDRRANVRRALEYMGLTPTMPLSDIAIDRAFIGSCTNARISDLRDAARVLQGRRVAPRVRAMVAPGSSTVRREAEAEGLDRIFIEAGFEWRQSGCSMCLAMNDDVLSPGERCASSTNRNFEGRQGMGGRTHLMSPAMVAAAAVTGHLTDVRDFKLPDRI
jgi:3-isopropylmalate/(R)-2-methylmalate dehydratase large subunit